MSKRKKIAAVIVVAVALAGIGALVRPASAAPVVTAAAVPDPCYDQYHARPSTTGWHTDPCSKYIQTSEDLYGNLQVRRVTQVDFYWSMSGGPHITGARATSRITEYSNPDFLSVQVTDQNLGRWSPYSGVLKSQPSAVNGSDDVLVSTGTQNGVGCGSTDGLKLGSGSYTLAAHGWFAEFLSGGGVVQNQIYPHQTSTYYFFAADGSCS